MTKTTHEDVFAMIEELGAGIIDEYILLKRLDISHGTFWKLRKILIEEARIKITHQNHKAFYHILA